MKNSKKNYLVILLVVILLTLAVGYAAFSQLLNIEGTATANGNFNVHFNGGSVLTNNGTATGTGDTLDVSVSLPAPGTGAKVRANIVNEGNVNAKLTGYTVSGTGTSTFTSIGSNKYSDGVIIVTVPAIAIDGSEVLTALTGGCTVTFDVEWDEDADEITTPYTATFQIAFTYEQAVDDFTPGTDYTSY